MHAMEKFSNDLSRLAIIIHKGKRQAEKNIKSQLNHLGSERQSSKAINEEKRLKDELQEKKRRKKENSSRSAQVQY